MYCIVPIQYCNEMYCIPNVSDKVVFVHRSYGPKVCSYSVLVYNLQLFAKMIFCLVFVSGCLMFYICLTWLMTSSVMSMMMSHHPAPKTNVLHPHPQGQTTQIQTAVHTRWLSKLTCSMPPVEVQSGVLGIHTPQMLCSS